MPRKGKTAVSTLRVARGVTAAAKKQRETDILSLLHQVASSPDEGMTSGELLIAMGKPANPSNRAWLRDRIRPHVEAGQVVVKRVYRKRIDKVVTVVPIYIRTKKA